MKNFVFISFILFQLFFSKIIIVNAQLSHGLLVDDYDCINNLLNYIQVVGLIDPTNNSNYCDKSIFNPNELQIVCAADNSIMHLNITAKATSSDIEYQHISCFTNLQQAIFNKFKFKIDAFGNENDSTKMKLVAVNIFTKECEFVDGELSSITAIIPEGTEILRITLSSTLSNLQKVKFSSVQKINKAFIIEYLFGVPPNLLQLPTYINDLATPNVCVCRNWEFIVDSIPSMSLVNVEYLTLKVFSQSSITFDNILTYTTIDTLNLIYSGQINLSNFLVTPTIKHLSIGGPITKPTSKMDFSNTIFETLDFGSFSPDFHINNQLPISKLPNTIKSFLVSNTNLNSFDVSLFAGTDIESIMLGNCNIAGTLPDITPITKLRTLGLSNNKFISSIPESYCSIPSLIINNNNLSGKLNTCFSCYVLYNTDLLENLNNKNLDLSYNCPNGSVVPSLKVSQTTDKSIYKFTVTGKGLYFNDPSRIPNFTFELIKSTQLYFEGYWNTTLLGSYPTGIELSFGNTKFKFLTSDGVAPKVLSYSRTESNFIFKGSSFSYNTSDFRVDVGGLVCTISEILFESISCSIALNDWNTLIPSSNDVKTVITNIVNGKSHQISISSIGTQAQNIVKDCTVTCLNNGFCSTSTANCVCPIDEWSGVDCSTRLYKCPNNCTYPNGVCQKLTGFCSCESNWQANDCSIPYKSCPDNCSGLGTCDNKTGSCSCKADYTGLNCSLPSQYISSIEPSNTNGGIVKIWGWFGNVHTGLTIKIGELNCAYESVSSDLIVCTVGGGSGTKSVTIIQNGVEYIGVDKYNYVEISYKCPNDCSNNGKCNTAVGLCKCNSKWGGFDCSLVKSTPSSSTTTTTTSSTTTATTTTTTSTTSSTPTPEPTPEPIIIPSTETKINTTSGSAIISNQQTSYEIRIISLVELNFKQEIVKTNLLQNQWIVDNSISNVYNFSQQLNGTDCIITYTIEELKEDRDYTFADLDLSLEKDNIKITIEIKNYPYISSLNTIQLQMESKIGENEDTTKEDGGECNKEDANIDTNQMNKDQLINYISISKDQKVLYGRFINRIVSDTKPTFITTSVVSNDNNNLMIGVNLPHCSESCLIDPDFGLLVSSNYKKCVDGKLVDNGRASWVLPVAIVIPCVVVASLIIVGAIIYSKKRTSILLTKEKYSLKLRGLSKKNQDELYMPK